MMVWTDVWQKRIGKEKIRSCVVLQNGRLQVASYKNRKATLKLHKVNSVTKSILSALIGLCLQQGLITDLDTPITTFFPEMKIDDPRKEQITIDHLLTMTPGYDWPEFGEWHYFCHMYYARNWVRYVLERPLECAPGERMNYNTGASHLLTAIVQRVSGMTAAAFAEQHLFRPLGIAEYHWRQDPQGFSDGGSGLALTTEAMARFGLLYLNGGRWKDQQILSAAWIAATTMPETVTYPYIGHYARHWWAAPPAGTLPGYYFALGYGGQLIIVVPQCAAVVAMTSELYARSLLPLEMFRESLLPALSSACP